MQKIIALEATADPDLVACHFDLNDDVAVRSGCGRSAGQRLGAVLIGLRYRPIVRDDHSYPTAFRCRDLIAARIPKSGVRSLVCGLHRGLVVLLDHGDELLGADDAILVSGMSRRAE